MSNNTSHSNTRITISAFIFFVFFCAAIFFSYRVFPEFHANEAASQASQIASALGVYSLIPIVEIVLLAYITKNVFVSIILGVCTTVSMLVSLQGLSVTKTITEIPQLLLRMLVQEITDPFNFSIMLMILVVCGMINVVDSTDGFRPLAQYITGKIKNAKDVNLITLLLGFLVSFDDYSCVLIVAPIMKPIADKMRVSREKLAFIVDATAAPCSALMIVSTWVSTELMAIEEGFALAGIHESSYFTFIRSILFSYYPIFCLIFILVTGLVNKEFGPMLTAEREARKRSVSVDWDQAHSVPSNYRQIFMPLLPIFIFAFTTLFGFFADGYIYMRREGLITRFSDLHFADLNTILGYAHNERVLLIAAVIASVVAVWKHISSGKSLKSGITIWGNGVRNTLSTGLFLLFTWTFATSIQQLGTCVYLVHLISDSAPYWAAPVIIFLLCCIISFSIGSIGTLFIGMPIAIPIAQAFLLSDAPTSGNYLVLVIACVLSGALFGDHCSPISDTTIMSSKACGCKNTDHVRTQLPYALVVAGCASLSCILSGFGISNLFAFIIGIILIVLLIHILGKNPELD